MQEFLVVIGGAVVFVWAWRRTAHALQARYLLRHLSGAACGVVSFIAFGCVTVIAFAPSHWARLYPVAGVSCAVLWALHHVTKRGHKSEEVSIELVAAKTPAIYASPAPDVNRTTAEASLPATPSMSSLRISPPRRVDAVEAITPLESPDSAQESCSLPRMFSFSYRDQEGGYLVRTVNIRRISSSGMHTYLEGFCQDRLDSRTFRTDRVRGDLTDMETGELVPVKHLLAAVRERGAMTFSPSRLGPSDRGGASTSPQTAVLFTGFSAMRRAELEEIAAAAGWDVRTRVGSTLDYLVAGSKAGPAKIAAAEEFGISVIDEELFLALAD